jgi:tetratricopeptide (TPR) repeat protein/transcriptional regulator with XRE-family HTH domain
VERSNAKAAGTVVLDSARLIDARKRAGLSRERLAELARGELAISAVTVKRAEAGRPVHLETARTLARLLAIPLDALLAEPVSGEHAVEEMALRGPEQRAFVGRRDEFARAQTALARVRAGKPAVLCFVGETGIGKTRLLRELCQQAQHDGFVWGLGQGQEHLSIPFGPIVQALAPLEVNLAAGEPDDPAQVREFLREGALHGNATQRDRNRLILFRTLTRAVRAACVRTPLLIAVDDWQWIDQGSLELFEQLVYAAAEAAWRGERCALLLIVTMRTQPQRSVASDRLARLCRESICERMELEGLACAETFELLTGLAISRPSHALTNAVHEVTAGNPLFVQEVVHLLRERGLLQELGGWTVMVDGAKDACMPESATAALVERCEALDRRCRRALTYAACLGMQFSLETLAWVMNEEGFDALEALEEAAENGLLDGRGQSFVFAHPLVRQVCRQLVVEARRQRIHHDIAMRLRVKHGDEQDSQLHEIAYHLVESGDLADTRMVFDYATRAARIAAAASAWDTAARFYVVALKAPFIGDAERAELHMQAGLAHCYAWELGLAIEHYLAAEQAFERLGDVRGKTRALNDRVSLAFSSGLPHSLAVLDAQLEQLGDTQPALSAEVMKTLSDCCLGREPQRALDLAATAVRIANELQDDGLVAKVSNSLALAHLRALHLDRALDVWHSGHASSQRIGDSVLVARYLQRIPLALGPLGRLRELEERADEAWDLHERYPNLGESSLILHARAWLALLRGRLDESVRYSAEALSALSRSNYVLPTPLIMPTLACAYTLQGRWSAARATLQQMQELAGMDAATIKAPIARYGALIAAHESTPAATEAERPPSKSERLPPDLPKLARLCAQVECAGFNAARIDPVWIETLRAAYERGILFTNTWVFALPRILGIGAALAQDWGSAERYFEESLRMTAELGAKTEHACTSLDFATALSRRGSPPRRAEELANGARAAFVALQMPALATRARAAIAGLRFA